eukprot:8296216-Heterocapsa_arctica.AAC.1
MNGRCGNVPRGLAVVQYGTERVPTRSPRRLPAAVLKGRVAHLRGVGVGPLSSLMTPSAGR